MQQSIRISPCTISLLLITDHYSTSFPVYAVPQVVEKSVLPKFFRETYESITEGNALWNQLKAPEGALYSWDTNSTYIHDPPFFKGIAKAPKPIQPVVDAYCLLNLGDSITTDHISPAGKWERLTLPPTASEVSLWTCCGAQKVELPHSVVGACCLLRR